MKLIVIDQFGKAKKLTAKALPRIGDKVDMFYRPFPTVTMVLMWPTKERLKEFGVNDEVEAIVAVE